MEAFLWFAAYTALSLVAFGVVLLMFTAAIRYLDD